MNEADQIKTRAIVDKLLRKQIASHKRIKAIKGLLGVLVIVLIITAGVFAVSTLVSAIMAPRAVVVLTIWAVPFLVALGSAPVILSVVYMYGKIDEKIRNMYQGGKR